jgi:hypothetical protein
MVNSQVEYMIIALLLKTSALKALLYGYIGGTVLFTILMFVEDCSSLPHLEIVPFVNKSFHAVSIVYILSTISGFTDFFIPLLLTYGKQYFYAAGGFCHLVSHCFMLHAWHLPLI